MLFIMIILLLIIAKSSNAAPVGEFKTDYLSKDKTISIKGIFVILIIISHFSQYVTLSGVYDQPYIVLKNHLNQMVVAMFWFYSGFGIMESIKNKGYNYVKTIPTKRFFTILLNFDIAVALFVILGWSLGKTYDLQTILWSLVGWKTVGNSNWYIFVTLVLYLLIFVSFFVVKWLDCNGGRLIGCILLTALTIAFVYSQMLMGRPGYTYNTAILLPLGCWYSLFKPQIERIVMKNDYFYSFFCVVNLLVYLFFYSKRWESIYSYSIWAISFVFMILLFTMKISINGNILNWFGNHVFSVYILQRIPMIFFDYLGISDSKKYVFFILSFICTVFLAMVYDNLTGKLINKIFSKKAVRKIKLKLTL